MLLENVITGWDGALCSTRFDQETGAFFVIAIHSRRRGPAAGGTRAMQYDSFGAAAADAARLASSMTLKMAAADLPMGGGKSVIALPVPRNEVDPQTWARILEIHAENLTTLNGSYRTGPDVGTSSADMDVIFDKCGLAFGRSESAGGSGSSGPGTGYGVYVAMKASAAEAGIFGLAGRRIAIQGLGAVGMGVLELARKDGAELVVTDVDPKKCELAATLGATVVEADQIVSVESDIFAPCAMGNVIDTELARKISTSVVAGGANNVLVDDEAGDELAKRGIVFAPDFIANSGGGIHLIGREVLGWSPEAVTAHIDGISETLGEVFDLGRSKGISPNRAAVELAKARLDRMSS